MLKSMKAKGVALIVTGVVGLLALSWAAPALAPGTASAAIDARGWTNEAAVGIPAEQAQPDTGFEDRVRDMLRDHMGLTGEEAEEWVGSMGQVMRGMHGDQADEMLEFCREQGGPGASGARGGMMGGSGGGMMGRSFGGMMGF